MKKLYIVRHAKSSWKIQQDDYDRSLTKKGKANLELIAEKIISRGSKIDLIISSSAKRTKKTAKIVAKKIGFEKGEIYFDKGLYLATPKTLLTSIQSTSNQVDELMVVAHNPGVTQIVNFLASEHFENVPTSGVACILFDVQEWSEIKNNGTLGYFIYPKMFTNTIHI